MHRRDLGKYIINLKLTKFSQGRLGGVIVCDLKRLKLTAITRQFGLLFRQAYRKVAVSKHASKQASMQVEP